MQALLQVVNLKKYFPIRRGIWQKTIAQVKAVDDVSLEIFPGETFGLVGESGCGKSTLGKTLIRLHTPSAGNIFFQNTNWAQLGASQLRQARKHCQMVFQDPYASLNPRMNIGRILSEPLAIHHIASPSQRLAQVKELMELVGLKASYLNRYPHEFSGGQRQRIAIARALMLRPQLIIADEPVSALDVSIQAQILNLMKDLQRQLQLTYIFISHDLSVIEYFCDRVAVMYLGKIVELAPASQLYNHPTHPYTQALLQAIPRIGQGKRGRGATALKGEVPSPINPPTGCHFHPRCPHATDQCRGQAPQLQEISPQHFSACHLVKSEHHRLNKD